MLEIALGFVVLVLLYIYFTVNFKHWSNKDVPCMKAYPVVGSMVTVFTLKESMAEFFTRAYREMYDQPFGGYFQGRIPAILIKDPELVKNIMIKDFHHFMDRGFEIDAKSDPLQAKNLFHMEGQMWKEMRAKLSPTFSSGRIKSLFPLILECADSLEKHLEHLAKKNLEVDIKEILARYTTDVISSCAFGVKSDSLNNPNDQFRIMGQRIFETNFFKAFRNGLSFFIPLIPKLFGFRFTEPEVDEFFRGMVRDVIKKRSGTGEIRKDFMQMLIELKDKGKLADEDTKENETEHHNSTAQTWTEDEITAQALVFFIGGFETSSSALTFALFELARRPDLQRTARQHIKEVLQRHNGEITYQALQDMTYLDWILQESLRKYPPLPILNRKCIKNYTIPGTDVTVEQGTPVAIPIMAMHHDPRYFPEPERFHPERFNTDANEQDKNQYVYMPFGEGQRRCIGLRFAQIESKLGLLSVLRKYEVAPNPRNKYPLSFDPYQFLLSSREDILIKIGYPKD